MNQHRRLITSKHLAMLAGTPLVAAFLLCVRTGPTNGVVERDFAIHRTGTDDDLPSSGHYETRSKQTPADLFYREKKKIPLPSVVHASLTELGHRHLDATEQAEPSDGKVKKNILVIGDVHGCYDDLLALYEKAVKENNSTPFEHVFLVGDLCNKGPDSAKVIKHVRLTPDWYTVRGNHDDGALAAALGDKSKLKKKKYQWVKDDREPGSTLSDEDVMWLAELPYTITIPGSSMGEAEDTIIVHAALIPYVDLNDQEIETMITVRDLLPVCDGEGNFLRFDGHEKTKGAEATVAVSELDAKQCEVPTTWASAWRGPQRVVFGHNAKRKLQMYPGNWAIGLDTGAVYGGQLTGIILPERKIVSIDTKGYSSSED